MTDSSGGTIVRRIEDLDPAVFRHPAIWVILSVIASLLLCIIVAMYFGPRWAARRRQEHLRERRQNRARGHDARHVHASSVSSWWSALVVSLPLRQRHTTSTSSRLPSSKAKHTNIHPAPPHPPILLSPRPPKPSSKPEPKPQRRHRTRTRKQQQGLLHKLPHHQRTPQSPCSTHRRRQRHPTTPLSLHRPPFRIPPSTPLRSPPRCRRRPFPNSRTHVCSSASSGSSRTC